jgi:hypothetical protein
MKRISRCPSVIQCQSESGKVYARCTGVKGTCCAIFYAPYSEKTYQCNNTHIFYIVISERIDRDRDRGGREKENPKSDMNVIKWKKENINKNDSII